MEKENIFNVVKAFKKKNLTRYGIKKIGIFGSAATGTFKIGSDIDIVVELEKPDLFILIGIKQDLEDIFQRHVDIVRYRKNMNRYLKKRIDDHALYV